MAVFDWSGDGHWHGEQQQRCQWCGEHWNRGRRQPCRWCGELAFLIDDQGLPAHKVCAEAAADQPATDSDDRFLSTFDLGRTA